MKLRVKMQDEILSKLNEILSMLYDRSNLVNNVLFFKYLGYNRTKHNYLQEK